MDRHLRYLLPLLFAGGAAAQGLPANYTLGVAEPAAVPGLPLYHGKGWRLLASTSPTGPGLSVEAGRQWFARLSVGRSLQEGPLAGEALQPVQPVGQPALRVSAGVRF